MCYGCMGFKSAAQLTQKQLDFLDKTPEEQIILMEKNSAYCPDKPMADQIANMNPIPLCCSGFQQGQMFFAEAFSHLFECAPWFA